MSNPRKVLTDLRAEYVQCRALGHQWDSFQPLQRKAAWGTLLSLRCVRCGKERFDTVDSLGNLSTRSYNDPPGYKISGGISYGRSELRVEMFRRMRAVGARSRHLRAVKGTK